MATNYRAQPNSCLLFPQNKDGNEKRPDYAGRIELEGAGDFRAAVWERVDRHGETYLALRLSKKNTSTAKEAGVP
jgi:uncharacterized protein (DUF736 family)